MKPTQQRSLRAEGTASRRGLRVVGVVLCLCARAGHAEPAPERFRGDVPQTEAAVTVDGRLDEPAWSRALVVPLPFETRPGENIEAAVRTECYVIHDRERLYFAFRAWDPDPTAIRAHLSDRDAAFSDDFVGVVIDPFNDERRAFEFFVNPLGVQMDLFLDDVNGSEDESWDAIWDGAGRITDEGYVVEMAIPFHQLRFETVEGVQTWGFDAVRFYPRSYRYRLSSQVLDRNIDCYLCQAGKIRGFEGISPGRNLEVVPTVTSVRTDRREEFPNTPLEQGQVDTDPGLSVKWGMTSNLILNATLHPDFSQVEADVAQLDVNERFSLFFPEKRPFFLEGADFFDTPLDAVFTRNVADPRWGLKVTGKDGRHALGVFAAEDDVTQLLIPGSQGSATTTLDLMTTDTVVRYRRDVGGSSALGVLATDRRGGEYQSSVAGVDGLIRFNDTDSVNFQYLRSATEYPGEVAEEFDQPAGRFQDDASWLEYRHDSREWFWRFVYRDRGRDFRADMGFMPQVDTRLWLGGLQRVWWGEEDDRWTRIELGGDWDYTVDQEGGLLENEIQLYSEIAGPRESFLFATAGFREQTFEGVQFDQRFGEVYFELEPTGDLFVGLSVRGGDAIDFENTRPADEIVVEPQMRWNLGRHVRLNLRHSLQRLEVAQGRLFEANLSQLRLIYQLDTRTFFRLVSQFTRIDRAPELFAEEVEEREERLFNQLLFSYKINPQTVFFLGYSDTALSDDRVGLTRAARSVFLKIGYAWVP